VGDHQLANLFTKSWTTKSFFRLGGSAEGTTTANTKAQIRIIMDRMIKKFPRQDIILPSIILINRSIRG
jgi:hypothetical protein